MNNSSEWLIVGKFGRPHGIKGFITVVSFTEPRDNILNYVDWHFYIDNQWTLLDITETKINNKSILVKIKNCDDRDDIARLTNIDIAVKRSQLQALNTGEYYWHELVGMHVVNEKCIMLGVVSELMATGSNDVLVIEHEEKRHLIPFLLDDVITDVDKIKRLITVVWDEDF